MTHTPQHQRVINQLRPLVVAVKRAISSLHEGPQGIPRKQVYIALGVGKDRYSRWENLEEPDMPNLLDLAAIVGIAGDPAPLRAYTAWVGEGWDLAPTGSGEGEELTSSEGARLLSDVVASDAALTIGIAHDLVDDGKIDRREAKDRLPLAEARLHQAQTTVDVLTRLALGVFQ